ncbi:LOW QUALITY PROTEIN: E3 SUMO-protein ligase NSE2-like [Crassostrea angulata]|uniref:E3 SUMO-protein ligase NSE2 n=3 Tax=Magallana gigas TaxID=29159 RepID=K1QEJ1_MAGGI|nr:E3 SUMO-protein ligase NSE2 [Crassostrea gigas]XP_034317493.1 E3 SUMO-protein ligase NSE2 [Crassostrea gigas]XP_052698031.1 LOW QUALITY PROTEIN: E3 SUMO-protein ligase NSE2-like [Crassostrea angulata]|eukprot:XP_011449553.1 PREDICTED: E3 SUMO-protein ligase NSE2 [Crassostrea gigas]
MAQFAVIEQAKKSLKTVQDYIKVGMETTIDVAQDIAESKIESEKEIDTLKSVMQDYVQMERDLEDFMNSVEDVTNQAAQSQEAIDLEESVEKRLQDYKNRSRKLPLEGHEKFLDLTEKIAGILNPDGEVNCIPQTPVCGGDEEMVLTQSDVNTRCPYTGKDMVNPVTNKHCKHNYDRDGIYYYIKIKKNKAKCPVGGCMNENPIKKEDLVENKELKRYIEKKIRQEKKSKK